MAGRPGAEFERSGLLSRVFASEIRAWHGQVPLAVVFWQKGVLASSVLIVLYATTVIQGQLIAEQALLILMGLYTAFILISIWRSALAAEPLWGLLARLLTIAWAANVAMILLFRELSLLIQFADFLRAG